MQNMLRRGLLLTLLLTSASASAVDGYGIELGHGDDATDMMRVHAKWNWDKKWYSEDGGYVTGYWEVSLGRWHGSGNGARQLWDLGLTPVFRNPLGNDYFFEIAIGAHFLSATRINDKRRFGGSYNFGDHIGIGRTFGQRGEYEWTYRAQHLSNAGIHTPNSGINFHEIRLTYNY